MLMESAVFSETVANPNYTQQTRRMQSSTVMRSVPCGTTATRCRLLELPAELKLHIYGLALTKNTTIWGVPYRTGGAKVTFRFAVAPPLASVCVESRWEALPLYYATNTFGFLQILRCLNMVSLGELAPHVKYLKKIRVEGCPEQCIHYDVNLCNVTSANAVEVYRPSCDPETSGIDRACYEQEKKNSGEAQALVDVHVAERGSDEGWSEVELVRLIDTLRAGHEKCGW